MHINGIEVKIGQRWITKDHEHVKISSYVQDETGFPWKLIYVDDGESAGSVNESGKYWHEDPIPHLKTLLEEVPTEQSQPQEQTYTEEQIRKAWDYCYEESDRAFSVDDVLQALKKSTDPEYAVYLKLKERFENAQ